MPNGESTDFEARYTQQRAAENADQSEFEAILMGSALLESGTRDEQIAGAMDEFDSEILDIEAWNSVDLELEGAAGPLFEQLEIRQSLLGDKYPFRIENNTLIYEPSESNVYEFCLAICQAPNITTAPYNDLPSAFEELSGAIAQIYLGEGSVYRHTGWPRRNGAPTKFKANMQPLNELTQEWVWNPDECLPDDPSATDVKDEGVDYVAWKPNLDTRAGHLFLLGQCACGDNWRDKLHDIDFQKIGRWFKPMTRVKPPLKAISTPVHVTNGLMVEAFREAGLVFDRIRLTLLAEQPYGIQVIRAVFEDDKLIELTELAKS